MNPVAKTVEDHVAYILGHGFSQVSFDYLRALLSPVLVTTSSTEAATVEALAPRISAIKKEATVSLSDAERAATEALAAVKGAVISPTEKRLQGLISELQDAIVTARLNKQ